jgi:hypothetical protein
MSSVWGGAMFSASSTEEVTVNHLYNRAEELFTAATARHAPPKPPRQETYEEASLRAAEQYSLEQLKAPEYVNVVTGVFPRDKPSTVQRLSAFFNHPWVIRVGGGLVVAAIIAAIVWAA